MDENWEETQKALNLSASKEWLDKRLEEAQKILEENSDFFSKTLNEWLEFVGADTSKPLNSDYGLVTGLFFFGLTFGYIKGCATAQEGICVKYRTNLKEKEDTDGLFKGGINN